MFTSTMTTIWIAFQKYDTYVLLLRSERNNCFSPVYVYLNYSVCTIFTMRKKLLTLFLGWRYERTILKMYLLYDNVTSQYQHNRYCVQQLFSERVGQCWETIVWTISPFRKFVQRFDFKLVECLTSINENIFLQKTPLQYH